MSEKIDMVKHEKGWVGFFVFEALGHNRQIMTSQDYSPHEVDAKLILNGVECDVVETLKFMGKQFDEMVEKRAAEIVKDKFDEKFFDNFNKIENLARDLKEEMADRIQEIICK